MSRLCSSCGNEFTRRGRGSLCPDCTSRIRAEASSKAGAIPEAPRHRGRPRKIAFIGKLPRKRGRPRKVQPAAPPREPEPDGILEAAKKTGNCLISGGLHNCLKFDEKRPIHYNGFFINWCQTHDQPAHLCEIERLRKDAELLGKIREILEG